MPPNSITGEVRLTPEELAAAPPNRVNHQVVDCRSSSDHIAASSASATTGGGRRRGGVTRGVSQKTPSGTLTLAFQVAWPEDSESKEGKLVETVQNEEVPLPSRVRALKVREPWRQSGIWVM